MFSPELEYPLSPIQSQLDPYKVSWPVWNSLLLPFKLCLRYLRPRLLVRLLFGVGFFFGLHRLSKVFGFLFTGLDPCSTRSLFESRGRLTFIHPRI